MKDIKKMNEKVIRKLKNERVSLEFVDLGDLKQCKVPSFSDVQYINEGSQGSCIICPCNQQDTVVPIKWQSKKSVMLYTVL